MNELLRFFMETVKGGILGMSIPLLVYAIYAHTKTRWNVGFQRSGDGGMGRESSDYRDEGRKHQYELQSPQYKSSKWFGPAPVIAHGLHEITRVGKEAEKLIVPTLLRIKIARGTCLYPFVGHVTCMFFAWAHECGGEDLVEELISLNPAFLQWHLVLATIYALIELTLNIWAYGIILIESAITAMLVKSRDFLCSELGKERGTDASRFLALLIDRHFDKQDIHNIRKMAYTKNKLSGRDFTAALVEMCEKKSSENRCLIPLTPAGIELYQEIREVLR